MQVADDAKKPLLEETSEHNETFHEIDEQELAIEVLGEIVGCHNVDWNRLALESPIRPYVIVRATKTGRIVHQTLKAEGMIWTVATNAYFALAMTPLQILQETLTVELYVKRKDSLQLTVLETICIGTANVKLSDAFQRMEERIDLSLPNGILTVRFRLATSLDRNYLLNLAKEPKLLKKKAVSKRNEQEEQTNMLVTETNETEVAGASFMNVISSALTTRSYVDQTTGTEMILAKPCPDPKRVKETTYLPRNEIAKITAQPSHEWTEAGSGNIGKVYLELLSCHGLPNMDMGAAGNFTDAFVAVVFEDAMVQSPVVDDELSPHWLPWTKRAFCFGMMHPSSTMYLGVFDYDLGISNHDPIGRVAVNLSNLQRDTDYTLSYDLFPSSHVTDRTAAGSITIRVRVEYPDQKLALLEALKPRPKFHINVRKEKSLAVLRYTCYGEYGDNDQQPFDLTVVRSYINEILEYKRSLTYCIGDTIRSLVFWRGQVRIGKDLLIPLHSFLFFCMTTTLVERPYMFPSFLLLSIAWAMIAAQTQRMQHPSPWHQALSLRRYIEIFRSGKSSFSFQSIEPNQGYKEAQEYEKAWEERLQKDLELAAQQAAMQQEILNMGNEEIHTKISGMIPLDLLERLTRYQAIVGRICQRLRFFKIIVTWEESFVSFWFTACVLGVGLVSLLLPWSFILLWTGRLVVYGLFGPHMMIVDRLLHSADGSDDAVKKAMEKFQEDALGARTRRQEAVKLRDIKCLAFGKFITLVPTYNLSRHFDRPLPSSHAVQRPRSEIKFAKLGIPGQHLFGTILPHTEADSKQFHDAMSQLEPIQQKLKRYLEDRSQGGEGTSHFSGTANDIKVLSVRSVDSDDSSISQPNRIAEVLSCPSNYAAENDTTTKDSILAECVDSPANKKGPSSRRQKNSFESVQEIPHDEERESGEVEVVLSSSGLERESIDNDNDVVEESPADPQEWRVLFFQSNVDQ